MTAGEYESFLSAPTQNQWKRVGARRRAGVSVPLFSLRSRSGAGIGELPDLKPLADWCRAAGLGIIQLLPLNDMGHDFAPYSAQSSFALDPVYLRLDDMAGAPPAAFAEDIENLKKSFPPARRVDYGIKAAKLAVLRKMFEAHGLDENSDFVRFREIAWYWLRDNAMFNVLKDKFKGAPWEEWPAPYRDRDTEALANLFREEKKTVRFHEWIQWQIYDQFQRTRARAKESGILLMGDIPFLTSRDSVDVWAHRDYFRLDTSSGAPPDLYFAGGQRWGMPPINREKMAENGFDYWAEKLNFAQNFYDLFRIDHVIGVFRLFTIPNSSPPERGGADGAYDPADERLWEGRGRELLQAMLRSTSMLPCGEDLGAVPACSYKVLSEMAIPGLDVQRWSRDWGKSYDFRPPSAYRKNAAAVVSTHDMSTLAAWWLYEAGTVDEYFFKLKCQERGLDAAVLEPRLFNRFRSGNGRFRWNPAVKTVEDMLAILGKSAEEAGDFIDLFRSTRDEREKFWQFLGWDGEPPENPTRGFIDGALRRAGESTAIFSIQLMQDWLSLDPALETLDPRECRINTPGSVSGKNWSYVMPIPVEDLAALPLTLAIRTLNEDTERL